MSTYAIGDIQGCFEQFQQLLALIHFNPASDTLWLTGDLVNRGPHSLEVLRFVKNLGDKQITILGNHDLHLLAVAYGFKQAHDKDTLSEILKAKDKTELIDWLRFRPLLHQDKNFLMTHAGLAPAWTVAKAAQLARELEAVLRESPEFLLKDIYGNLPDHWDDNLQGLERLRCIVNYFTRMRFCYADGRLDLTYKGNIANKPKNLLPWFEVPGRKNADAKIIFGHWAALNGEIVDTPNVYPLDTGCVWGNALTALRLEDEKIFSVSCAQVR